MKSKITVLVVVAGALFFAGCSSVRVQQFQDFAQAGKAYTSLVSATLDQAVRITIEEDSQVLLQSRSYSDSNERMNSVVESNNLLKEKIRLFNDIRCHVALLESYFLSLEQLAAGDASQTSGLLDACGDIVNEMGQLSERIETASIGGMSVSEAAETVARIAVKRYQRKALDTELAQRAQVIERELDLQLSAMKLIGEQIQQDLSMELNRQETDRVVRPYMKDPLPENWKKQRLDFLLRGKEIVRADAAAKAAQHLKRSYIALVENRYTQVDMKRFQEEFEKVAELSEQIFSQ